MKHLEKEMATHILYSCLENPMDRETCQGYSPWGHKESDTTVWLTNTQYETLQQFTAYVKPVNKCYPHYFLYFAI